MLPRILEPEVMSDPQEALDYDAMDHEGVNRAFVTDLLRFDPTLESANVSALDLGTGTALIAIELARRTQHLSIAARDMSDAMLTQARRNIEREGMQTRVITELADAKKMSVKQFHLVISNSVVHHMTEPSVLISAALNATAKGGVLFVRDLLRPPSRQALGKLVDQYAAPSPDLSGKALEVALRQRGHFSASLHAALTIDEAQTVAMSVGIDASAIKQTSDRHWTLALHVA